MRRAPLTCARVENYQTVEAADEKYIKIDPCAPGNGNPRGISAICTLMALFLKATDRISLSLFYIYCGGLLEKMPPRPTEFASGR